MTTRIIQHGLTTPHARITRWLPTAAHATPRPRLPHLQHRLLDIVARLIAPHNCRTACLAVLAEETAARGRVDWPQVRLARNYATMIEYLVLGAGHGGHLMGAEGAGSSGAGKGIYWVGALHGVVARGQGGHLLAGGRGHERTCLIAYKETDRIYARRP